MLPDRVSNPGPLTYESGVLPIALRGPALIWAVCKIVIFELYHGAEPYRILAVKHRILVVIFGLYS